MPLYGFNPQPTSIEPGGVSFQAIASTEQVNGATPYNGERAAIAGPCGQSQRGLRVEVQFGGAPGAFEVDLQEADTDTANAYQNVTGAALTAVNANNWGAMDLTGVVTAKLIRPVVKSLTNNVTVSLKLSQAP